MTREVKEAQKRTKCKTSITLTKHDIAPLAPITHTQDTVIQEWDNNDCLILKGCAGTGKTYLAIQLALLSIAKGYHKKLIIVRSAVPTRDAGFLPGTLEEKTQIYEDPYQQIFTELSDKPTYYDKLKEGGFVSFCTTSYMRGLTFNGAVIIFDEFQSAVFHEIDTVITRMGEGTKLVLCGDTDQNDLVSHKEVSGLNKSVGILSTMKRVSIHDFGVEDIVRSGFCKSYLTAKHLLIPGK